MSKLTHEQIRGLLEAYALNILSEGEAQVVARHLTGCADCRADLAAYRRVTDELALATPDETLDAARDAALKQRLMARIQTRDQETGAQPSAGLWGTISAALRGWRPVAVALAVLIVLSIALWWQQGRHAQDAGERQITLTATDVAPEARGVIQIGTDTGRGMLTVEGLPALGSDGQYQLWLIKDGDRDSGGVFSVTDDGKATVTIAAPHPLDDYAAYGITIEPFGGSPGPTGQRVLGYNL
jgi:anti-sigma-K factor RskA